MSQAVKLSHRVIASLYEVLRWYSQHPGAGYAAQVLSYYRIWESLHALTMNISNTAWSDIRSMAKNIGVTLSTRNDEWLFLFAIETYIHLFVRALSLSKLGRAPQNFPQMAQQVESNRSLFAPSVFEWVELAYSDSGLPSHIAGNLQQRIDHMLEVMYNLNTITLTADAFRVLYQNLLPPSLRRSLGEFYTDEKLVDEVLDASGLDGSTIQGLYERYRKSRSGAGEADMPLVLDPACGSGTFLVRFIRRVFEVLGCRSDIVDFLEDTVVGIDINPFAVEMAKLNIVLAIADEMASRCKSTYTPKNIKVYWADSLVVTKTSTNVFGAKILSIDIPILAPLLQGNGTLPIPLLPCMSSDELTGKVYEAVKLGKPFDVLLNELKTKCGREVIEDVKGALENLYKSVDAIEKAGNSRILELVENASIVASLLGRCDYVLGNPPWVRIHGIAHSVVKFLRQHYEYYKPGSAYDPKFKETKIHFKEQHDYSLAFVERGLQFLKEGGVLGYVITSKVLKSMYAGKMREDLLTNYKILELRDYSLYPRPLFQDAVNYPLVIAVKKEKPHTSHEVKVRIVNTVGDAKYFRVPQLELPLDKRDMKSPWLSAPLSVIKALRKIQKVSLRLGDVYVVTRGVETSADEIFIVRLADCKEGVAKIQTDSRRSVDIEADVIYPLVKGENIDPFYYVFDRYIILPYDISTFDPLWDCHQQQVLAAINALRSDVKVDCAGRAVVYMLNDECDNVATKITSLANKGFTVKSITPCAVRYCFEVLHNDKRVLLLNLESTDQRCRVYAEGLRIPDKPLATRYFLDNLRVLVNRESYRADAPPWGVPTVSSDKFKDYRIAWQEIAKHFEVCALPIMIEMSMCGTQRSVLVVPYKTVYFIVEPNPSKALKLLVYMNSELARNLIKLWAWVSRGGYYRHLSASVAQLPIPLSLLQCCIRKMVNEALISGSGEDLNTIARKLLDEHGKELEEELRQAFNLTNDEYNDIIEYGKWLNELGGVAEEIEQEEE